MTNTPKISIVMTSYNYAPYISQAIESIIHQTYGNWELVIVDDGSKDNSLEIIKKYCKTDSRIKLYCHKYMKNKGLPATVKLGIKKALYDWIVFLESDDALEPSYLEEKIKIIQNEQNVNFIFNDYRAIGDESFGDEAHHKIFQRNMENRTGFSNYKNDFYCDNPVPTFSVVMLRKSLLNNINYNTPIKPYLDRFLWGQIASKTYFYYIDKPLTLWRKHPASYMNKKRPKSTILFYLKLGLYLPDIYIKKIKRFFVLIKILMG